MADSNIDINLSKGDKVYVEGRLKNRQWQGEDGQTRYATEVQVHDFTFLSTKKESLANAQNATPQPQKAQNTNVQEPANPPVQQAAPAEPAQEEDDLPF